MKRKNILAKLMLSAVLGCMASVLLTGCKSEGVNWAKAKDPFAKKNDKQSNEPKVAVPERMVVIWKDAVYEHPALEPTRGIGGRVYFYDREDNPIKVDGEIVVYGFDDTTGEDKTEADKKFVFKQESLASHYNATALGPSYSVWLPWDKKGNKELSVSLIPVFRDVSGKVVRSSQTVCVLPGPETDKRQDMASAKSNEEELISAFTSMPGVQQIATSADLAPKSGLQTVAHLEETENGPAVNKNGARIRSTTISLPADTATRLQQASRGIVLPSNPTNSGADAVTRPTAPNQSAARAPGSAVLGAPLPTNPQTDKAETRDAGRTVFGLPGSLK